MQLLLQFHATSLYANSFRDSFYKNDHHFNYIFNQIEQCLEPIEHSRPPRAKLVIVSFETRSHAAAIAVYYFSLNHSSQFFFHYRKIFFYYTFSFFLEEFQFFFKLVPMLHKLKKKLQQSKTSLNTE